MTEQRPFRDSHVPQDYYAPSARSEIFAIIEREFSELPQDSDRRRCPKALLSKASR